MRIILGPKAGDTRILLEDGRDVTGELQVSELVVEVEAGGLTRVRMACYASEVQVKDILPGCVTTECSSVWLTTDCSQIGVSPEPTSFGPQLDDHLPPEVVLNSFKV